MRFLQITYTLPEHAKLNDNPLIIAMAENTWRNVSALHSVERYIGHMAFTRKEVAHESLTKEQVTEAIRVGTILYGYHL